MFACALLAIPAIFGGCGSDTVAPDTLSKIPDFIFVSDQSGAAQLYTWHHGTSTILAGTMAGDGEPQSAAGKIVFTRYGASSANPEIYMANVDGSDLTRLTVKAGVDNEPSLSHDGRTVVFVSNRSGTFRIWTMNADGSNAAPLNTGSSADIPESSPRFNPADDQILFGSPRTNTTQIWTVPAAGGEATQVTHEANGAFSGSWSPDGDFVFYVDGVNRAKIHRIATSSGSVVDYVTNGGNVSGQDCSSELCLVAAGDSGGERDLYAYFGAGDASPLALLNTSADEYDPAFLHP
jgi:Tol biopolymer transport system component